MVVVSVAAMAMAMAMATKKEEEEDEKAIHCNHCLIDDRFCALSLSISQSLALAKLETTPLSPGGQIVDGRRKEQRLLSLLIDAT